MCRNGVIIIFNRNRTLVSWLITTIADKGSFADASALLKFKAVTNPVTDMTGTAWCITEKEFLAGVSLPAAKAVNAKVVWIVEAALVPCIGNPVFKHLIRDGRGILAEAFGDFPKGLSFIQRLLNKRAILEGKMLMISWY